MKVSELKPPVRTVSTTKTKPWRRHSLPPALYERVARELRQKVRVLVPGKLYTLRQMFGEDDWLALGNGYIRRKAGECFAHMVYTGMFPLTFRQYKKYRTKYYHLE